MTSNYATAMQTAHAVQTFGCGGNGGSGGSSGGGVAVPPGGQQPTIPVTAPCTVMIQPTTPCPETTMPPCDPSARLLEQDDTNYASTLEIAISGFALFALLLL